MNFYHEVIQEIETLAIMEIPEDRLPVLKVLEKYLTDKIQNNKPIVLNFICTHNSRRSQFAQVWAQVLADYFNLEIKSFSGGVEVTAFNPRAIAALERIGFKVENSQGNIPNPTYVIKYTSEGNQIFGYSKLYDHKDVENKDFVAIMTCSDADQNCPFIPNAEARVSLTYEDPKRYDDTSQEQEAYTQRSRQIASELYYIFNNLKRVS